MTCVLGRGTGPLRGLKVVELAGIGPGPHACTILADLGADVIRIDRPGGRPLSAGATDLLSRGRPSVALDLEHPDAIATVLELVTTADVLVEGFRPGTTERLGLGPDACLGRNPRLVYGRMTGWGQEGPLATTAGHDLSYIAVTGALHAMGQDRARPHFPSNLVGDFGGGSTYLVIGVLAAVLEARVSGLGQVVDAAVVDGTAHLNALAAGLLASGLYREERATNLLDGGAPFYDVYETADGRHLAVAALEPKFCTRLVELLGIASTAPERGDPATGDSAASGELRRVIADAVASRTQAEWVEIFEGSDACVSPVIPLSEAFTHPHLTARGTFLDLDGIVQPAPAPRFSRTDATLTTPPPTRAGQHTREALTAWGITDVDGLIASGAAAQT
jgi:alpha-methylacyl-CoA racemase